MELSEIREQLNKLDSAICYMVALRLSLAVLVGQVKKEQGLPLYQPDREKDIYESHRVFSEQTGIDPELLSNIYHKLIAATISVEDSLDQYLTDTNEAQLSSIQTIFEESQQNLDGFISRMDNIKNSLKEKDITRKDFISIMSKCW